MMDWQLQEICKFWGGREPSECEGLIREVEIVVLYWRKLFVAYKAVWLYFLSNASYVFTL